MGLKKAQDLPMDRLFAHLFCMNVRITKLKEMMTQERKKKKKSRSEKGLK